MVSVQTAYIQAQHIWSVTPLYTLFGVWYMATAVQSMNLYGNCLNLVDPLFL